MRDLLAGRKDLEGRLEHVESTQERHTSVIKILVDEIEALKRVPPPPPKRRIGFTETR